jgi:DNA replication protein DnaC
VAILVKAHSMQLMEGAVHEMLQKRGKPIIARPADLGTSPNPDGYIERAEPIILIGDCGTGKTHLLTGLCVAACRQKRRVRFATAAALVNELVEAKQQLQLRRILARWERYDLIAIDEVGYVPMADLGAEFLFQVIAERAEKATVIITTNLPFSEWTKVVPNARLCKALLDRITDRAHIIETGADSFRFRRSVEKGRTKTTG